MLKVLSGLRYLHFYHDFLVTVFPCKSARGAYEKIGLPGGAEISFKKSKNREKNKV